VRLIDRATTKFLVALRAWLDENAPPPEVRARRSAAGRPTWLRSWQRTLFDAGWLLPTWEPGLGGRSARPVEHLAYLEELARRNLPRTADPVSVDVCVPAVFEHGSDDQVDAWVVPALRADVTWCLAPIGDGERAPDVVAAPLAGGWQLSGTLDPVVGADGADRLLCVAAAPPVDGPGAGAGTATDTTAFAVDLAAPGVEVRPSAAARAGMPEPRAVVLGRVRVGADEVIGEPGGGAIVLQTLLGRLHTTWWVAGLLRAQRSLDALVHLVQDRGLGGDTTVRAAVSQVRADLLAARALAYRAIVRESEGRPAPEVAMLPIVTADVERAIGDAALDLLGPAGLEVADTGLQPWLDGAWMETWLTSFTPVSSAVAQQQAVAERVLGLPHA